MQRRVFSVSVIAVLVSTIWTTTAPAENFLESGILRYDTNEGLRYDVFIDVNKDGATTCELGTSSGSYSLSYLGGAFRPGQDFFDDAIGLSFADLEDWISVAWTLTWDPGPEQTVVTIEFGTIEEGDFPSLPVLTEPPDGDSIEIPGDPNPPTVEWINITGPPDCDFASVFITDEPMWWNAQDRRESDELSCTTTSWTPPEALPNGTWYVTVINGYDAREVPVGITVVEGTWSLDNEDWLVLGSIDGPQVVPVKPISWSAIKAGYR